MLRNYFTIPWRSLTKNKLHTIINVFGLTVGVSSCLVIFLIVSFELSYNRQIPDADRIYRVYSHFRGAFEGTNSGVNTGAQVMVKEQFTGLEKSVAFHTYQGKTTVIENQNKKDFENQGDVAIVSPDYFDLIQGYEWIEGSAITSLTNPKQVVLTTEKAKIYFGTDDFAKIIGKEIRYNDSLVLSVSGIIKPPPYRSDFTFNQFISFPTIDQTFLKKNIKSDNWDNTSGSSQLFVKVSETSDRSALENQFKKMGVLYKENNKGDPFVESITLAYELQPLAELHFNSDLRIFQGSRDPAHKGTLTTLTIVASLLLLIAAINFINLETAQAVKRAKEVGVRKVLGSSRMQLIAHFLVQSMILTLLAVLLSLPLTELGLIFFKDFVPAGVSLNLTNPTIALFLIAIIFIVGVLSGMYPAFVLSSFLPALALKNQAYINSTNTRSAYLRKSLIVFQFGVAQLLIIGTMVIISQINFMLDKDLGFKKDAIIHFTTPWQDKESKRLVLKGELEQLPEAAEISMCAWAPSDNGYSSNVLIYKTGKEEIKTNVFRKYGDEKYIPLYDIKIIAGRNLLPADSMREIVVNEAYLRELNLTPNEALGKEIWEGERVYPIVGVVKDFHISSLRAGYLPVSMANDIHSLYSFSIKLPTKGKDAKNFQESIAKIEMVWKKVYPDAKFEYKFVDDITRNFYEAEQKMSKLASTAMTIAIIICCLGLFGLASYTSIQRTKEIGIRKVLGATVNNIVLLLSTDFLKLVIIAFIVAAPLAYFGAEKFLTGYAFHTNIGWPLFALAGAASVALAFVTVSYQAIKAALTNPVESLRSE
jgi:putative ABC transport system permease protein